MAPSQQNGNEYVFPRTVDEHVVPVVDVVANETVTTVHVATQLPVII